MMQNEWNTRYQGKRVMVLGMARSGVAAAKLLHSLHATPVLNDTKNKEQLANVVKELEEFPIEWRLGENAVEVLDTCDILLISPGVPLDAPVIKKAQEQGKYVVGELEFASQFLKGDMLCITGTNGKTTTVTLLGEILKNAGYTTHVAGNIGYPLSSVALSSKEGEVTVVEVSSFQLETMDHMHPKISALLNVTPDHLERHHTMSEYIRLKKRLFENQNSSEVAVLNAEDAVCQEVTKEYPCKPFFFSSKQTLKEGICLQGDIVTIFSNGEKVEIIQKDKIKIPGEHNLENAMVATAMAYQYGVSKEVIAKTLQEFSGVEHRIEFVKQVRGVSYINDSKGTNEASTIKAVQAVTAKTYLILGGYDKHVSFESLAKVICSSSHIQEVLLIGQTAPQIRRELAQEGYEAMKDFATLEETVQYVGEHAKHGETVLFSPACASFDMFKDYEQRGRIFKALVHALD